MPVATALTRLVLLVMGILGLRGPVATVPTRRVLLAMVIHVHVAMARIAHVSPAATATQAAGLHVAMAILRVVLRVPGETGPIRRALRATVRVQIVREVTVRIALVAIAQIVHAQIVRTGRVPIVLTATSPAVSGSPMGESVVHFERR